MSTESLHLLTVPECPSELLKFIMPFTFQWILLSEKFIMLCFQSTCVNTQTCAFAVYSFQGFKILSLSFALTYSSASSIAFACRFLSFNILFLCNSIVVRILSSITKSLQCRHCIHDIVGNPREFHEAKDNHKAREIR